MTSPRTCTRCAAPIDALARADARYCSGRCRVAAHRAARGNVRAIPAALREAPRWVRHVAKRPVTVTGRPASSTDAATWATFDAATASKVGDGLGFVFDGSGIVGIDLDHALDAEGRPLPWAAAFLATLPATYTEVSPSGTGLHVYGYGHTARGRRVRVADADGAVEVYATGRYFTVTGRRFNGAPASLADLGDLEALVAPRDDDRAAPSLV